MADRTRMLAPYIFAIALFLIWEIGTRVFDVSVYVLPRPSQFFGTLYEFWDGISFHATQTLLTTLVGFAIGVSAGAVLGAACGASRTVYATIYPALIGFYSIPKVALVPIFVIWFGSGTAPALLTSTVICIFPVLVNVATGVATTERDMEDVLRSLGGSRFDILRHVSLPRSLPYFFASLKVAISLAFVGTVISETVAANRGIGTMMVSASADFDVPLVFAGLVLLAAMGICMYAAFALVERRMVGWAKRDVDFTH
ncbi:MAG: ABC transporter permease [Alphaproteobacteria bacterium]|nr:ABC transporter permease [Alphaproteobacteria bacterium]